jgi:hypothetical protein
MEFQSNSIFNIVFKTAVNFQLFKNASFEAENLICLLLQTQAI